MTRQRVDRQQANVDQEHQRPHAHPEFSFKKEGMKRVLPQERQKNNREIQSVSVQILEDKRKLRLTAVRALRLAHGTGRRIKKKRAVVRFPVVVASSPKTQRPAQNQNRRRPLPPAMIRINQGRIKWRQIRSPFIKFPLKRPQSRVKPKS